MQNKSTWSSPWQQLTNVQIPRQMVVGVILAVALIAFEIFNFDTTKFALNSLLGDVSFLGLGWAAILATAFCAIDFAGLVRLFTPERGADEPNEVWYLRGTWLLGATMNAMMTWWAVSLTLLNHNFGNEVLSRDQLLTIVPIFVATLVWLTRILFIGSLTVAGERILYGEERRPASTAKPSRRKSSPKPARRPATNSSTNSRPRPNRSPRPGYQAKTARADAGVTIDIPSYGANETNGPAGRYSPRPNTVGRSTTTRRAQPDRIRQRPPRPNGAPGRMGTRGGNTTDPKRYG